MIKRKRNKKLENDIKYNVLSIGDADPELLETFKLNNLNHAGMEADEEREHHLKNIITRGAGEIPTPVVSRQPIRTKHELYRRPKEYIKWEADVPNVFLVEKSDRAFLGSAGISEEAFLSVVDPASRSGDTDSRIKEYLGRRTLKVAGEDAQSDAYACFRKRVPKNARKSRRNEAAVSEKLRKMWIELSVLESLYMLHHKRCELEREYLECSRQILRMGTDPGHRNGLKRKVYTRLFRKRKIGVQAEYYKSCGPLSELSSNYEKIRQIRGFLYRTDLKISACDLEKEAAALENYKKRRVGTKEKSRFVYTT